MKSLHDNATQVRNHIEQLEEDSRKHFEILKSQNRDAFEKVKDKDLEADGEQERVDTL